MEGFNYSIEVLNCILYKYDLFYRYNLIVMRDIYVFRFYWKVYYNEVKYFKCILIIWICVYIIWFFMVIWSWLIVFSDYC